mmetsp:Transcript_137179/g.273723  ORF Transcript_137179/g.273723 Transcript_137179/m.273723 type:complete len:449 (+) Transcript_137179:92-1438(+)
MSAEHWNKPLGDPPHVALRLKPAIGAKKDFFPEDCQAIMGKAAPVAMLKEHFCRMMGLPPGSALLMHEGKDLEDSKTLTENNVVLPGPAARRRGEMPEILFDLTLEEVERQREAEELAHQMVERTRREEETRRRQAEEAEKAVIMARLKWEQDRMLKEETLQRAYARKLMEDREAAQAQVLAGLPMELRRIHYTADWGITVEQRLREIARQADITLQDCVDKVSIVTAHGGLLEMFSGGNAVIPEKKDFPFVLVFGPISVQVQGPTHMNLVRFAQSEQRALPSCWEEKRGNGLIPLPSSGDEFLAVTSYFRGTLGWLPTIVSIERVQNEEVYSRFKGINEPGLTIMFHGCRSPANEDSIVRDGFLVSKCRSGGTNYGTWCAYAASYSDSGFVFQERDGLKHIFVVVVSRTKVVLDNQTMRVVGQDCAYPLWLVKYRNLRRQEEVSGRW